MSILQIRKAQREGARLVIGLAGVSGSGKTYTALQLAYGLANGNAEKIGFLDTENKRGSLYADIIKNKAGEVQPFLIGDLYAPFSPQRYIDSVLEFQAAGVEVLIIDSVSHEWEGFGGCQEIATAANPRFPDWKKAKGEHKRFINTLLQTNAHIIVCIRAREKVEIIKEKNDQGKLETIVRPLGLQPIQESNFMFEMTAAFMMHEQGQRQDVLKLPEELQTILGSGQGYIGAREGLAIRKWVDGAKQLDPALEAAKNSLQTTTERGMDALSAAWTKTPKAIKTALGVEFLETLKKSAAEFDRLKTLSTETETDPGLAALNMAAGVDDDL